MSLETQDDGPTVADDYTDVFAEDPGVVQPDGSPPSSDTGAAGNASPAVTDPPATGDAPTDSPDAAPSADSTPATGAEGAPAPEPPAAAAPDANPFVRPDGAAPLEFRVDGRPVTIDGAWLSPDGQHYVIPRQTWDQEIKPRWIANRTDWSNRERGYHEKIRALETGTNAREEQANAVLAQLDSLMQKGPEAVAEWLDNYTRNFPLLKAEAEKAALQKQVEAANYAVSQRAEEERQQLEIPRLQNELAGQVEQLLKDPRYAVLSGTQDENVALLKDLWFNHASAFFVRADRDYPEYGIPRGMMVFQPERLEQWLTREADRTNRTLKRSQKAEKADARNHAAVAPSKTFAPQPPKPAAPMTTKKPTPAAAPSENEYEAWKENMLRQENWNLDE